MELEGKDSIGMALFVPLAVCHDMDLFFSGFIIQINPRILPSHSEQPSILVEFQCIEIVAI